MHSHTGGNVCVNTRVAQAMQTRVSPRTRGKSLPPRKLHEGWMHTGQRREGEEEGWTCYTRRWITKHTREAARAPSIPLPDSSISRLSGESTFPSSTRDASFLPHPYPTITPTEYRNLWMDGRVEGRRRLEEFRRGRKSRAPLVNLGECTRGKGEGVESVMSRNLGVPRIYSRWRGGSTNRACREFAIVIYEYAGWFVLWTRLAATAGISVFLSVCCRGHACAAILCQWSFDRMYGVVRGQCRRWNELK